MNFAHLAAKIVDPSTICLMVLAGAAGFLLLRTQKSLARLRSGDSTRPPNVYEAGGNSDVIDRWELELHEKARAFSAQIDTKLALLQTLVSEAHDVATRLEAALDREEELHGPLPAETDSTGLELDQLDPAEFRLEPSPIPNGLGATTGDRREEIYTLADYGFNVGEIARRIGRPRGEVELVLSLRTA